MNEEMKRNWTVRAAKIRMKTAELVLHGNGGTSAAIYLKQIFWSLSLNF